MPQRIVLFGFMLLFLSGCSLFSVRPPEPEVLLLLPPSEGPTAALWKQKITIDAGDEQHQLLVVIRLDREQVKLRILLPTGQRLLSLDYDGDSLQQKNLSSLALPGEEILAMMQFALWPMAAIEKYYHSDKGWQLTFDSEYRMLKTTAGVIVKVRYEAEDDMTIEHYPHHYRVRIKALEKADL